MTANMGFAAAANALSLTLLRSGWDPDADADIGLHRFTYAMLAFAGTPPTRRFCRKQRPCMCRCASSQEREK